MAKTLKSLKKGEDKPSEKTRKQQGVDLYDTVGGLTNRDVTVDFKAVSNSSATWTALAINLLPVLIMNRFCVIFCLVSSGPR